MNLKWNQFASTGKILDYLSYKEIDINRFSSAVSDVRTEGEHTNAYHDRGNCSS